MFSVLVPKKIVAAIFGRGSVGISSSNLGGVVTITLEECRPGIIERNASRTRFIPDSRKFIMTFDSEKSVNLLIEHLESAKDFLKSQKELSNGKEL